MTTIQNIAQLLLAPHLAARPDKTAFIQGERKLTYRQLCEGAYRFAHWLQAEGVPAGARVAIVLPDSFALIQSFFGGILAGVVPVLGNSAASADDIGFLLQDVESTLLLAPPESVAAKAAQGAPRAVRLLPVESDQTFEQLLAAHPASASVFEPEQDDIAFMLYTSGSTGEAKGVPHRHSALLFSIETLGKRLFQITENDTVFVTSKLSFVFGVVCNIVLPVNVGASAMLMPDQPTPEILLQLILRHRPTVLMSVPSLYNLMLKAMTNSKQLHGLRLCVSAGEALPASIAAEWHDTNGVALMDCIGSTETLNAYIVNRISPDGSTSFGSVVPPFEARLANANGQPVVRGEAGELQLRGGSIAPYYWNRPEITAETMLAGGWLRTGDIYIERDGGYVHQGRTNDLFKVDAQWVSPTLIENALRTHPAVHESAVVGRLVADMMRPWAFVVLAPGFAPGGELIAELREHVGAQLQRFMVPVRFVFMDALPKTSTGKVQRLKLP
ncbi:MAG: benzoate-CoA ligase [Burkholderiaceae bacterium]|nr:benzoate-CoA ligase [Burkholderiaceae bacterium]